MLTRERFATAINCIDGRAQGPVTDWLRLHFNVDYVDMITEPGADKCLVHGPAEVIEAIERKVKLVLKVRGTKLLAVAAHHDCLANPVSKEEHSELIIQGIKVVASWGISERIVGLYVNEYRWIDVVFDTQDRSAAHYL